MAIPLLIVESPTKGPDPFRLPGKQVSRHGQRRPRSETCRTRQRGAEAIKAKEWGSMGGR